jgi:hypothetical protein
LPPRSDREFCRGVDPKHLESVVPSNRRGADDLALLSALFELLRRSLDTPQNALDVDLEDFIDLFRRHFRERLHLRDSGVVDHYVEPGELLLDVVDGGIDIVPLGDIGTKCRRPAPDLSHLISDGFHFRLVEVHNRNVGAIACKAERDCTPDALTRACHEDDLSGDGHPCLLAFSRAQRA